jgi:predicted protein tyrosine phosphatase
VSDLLEAVSITQCSWCIEHLYTVYSTPQKNSGRAKVVHFLAFLISIEIQHVLTITAPKQTEQWLPVDLECSRRLTMATDDINYRSGAKH